jgi:CDP-diacylglycerol--serine O-phosphatidyltransferase
LVSDRERRSAQKAVTDRQRLFGENLATAAAVVPAATVFAYPAGFQGYFEAWPVLSMVIVPALLMVSTVRYRSFKTLDLQARRSYPVLFLLAVGLAALASSPRFLLLAMAYTYLASAFIGLAWHRLRRRQPPAEEQDANARPVDDVAL